MLFRLLFFLLMFYAAYRFVQRLLRGMAGHGRRPAGEVETFRDPVCGTYVTRGDAVVGKIAGKTVYFCSQACLEHYLQDSSHTTTEEQ